MEWVKAVWGQIVGHQAIEVRAWRSEEETEGRWSGAYLAVCHTFSKCYFASSVDNVYRPNMWVPVVAFV